MMGTYTGAKADIGFVRKLDRGIDDMEAGRELPLKDPGVGAVFF